MPGLIDKGLLTRRAPTQSDRGITKSAMRVCEVFELFAQRQAPLPLREVTRSLGYPASSASALLKSLVEMGYLEYDLRQRTYFPTIRMSSMVSWVERARFGTGGILLAMQRVHAATQETVNLGTQSDLYAQYICQIASQLHVPHERIRQTVRSLDRSGTGWLILSAYGDEEVEHLLRRAQHARRGAQPAGRGGRARAGARDPARRLRLLAAHGGAGRGHDRHAGAARARRAAADHQRACTRGAAGAQEARHPGRTVGGHERGLRAGAAATGHGVRVGIQPLSALTSTCGCSGLSRCWSKPASRARSRSCGRAKAVRATARIGGRPCWRSSARMAAMSS